MEQLLDALLDACADGDVDVVEAVLRRCSTRVPRPTLVNGAVEGETPLYVACFWNRVDVARLLIDYGADANKAKLDGGATPLIVASDRGHLEVTRLLVDNGADADKADDEGWTPLYAACDKARLEVARLLIAHGADVDKAQNTGATPLFIACVNGRVEIARVLLAHGADVAKADNIGATPLHAACVSGHASLARLLLDNDADVDARTNDGVSPLVNACGGGHVFVAGILLARGADVESLNEKGVHSPLAFAIAHRHRHVARLLVDCGADLDRALATGGAPRRVVDESRRTSSSLHGPVDTATDAGRRGPGSRGRSSRCAKSNKAKPCLYCGKYVPDQMKKCRRCRRRYCSAECQQEHWQDHKAWCKAHRRVEDDDETVVVTTAI